MSTEVNFPALSFFLERIHLEARGYSQCKHTETKFPILIFKMTYV